MTCRWEPASPNTVLFWSRQPSRRFKCTHQRNSSCTWPSEGKDEFMDVRVYYFYLCFKPPNTNNCTRRFQIETEKLVKPNPVIGLRPWASGSYSTQLGVTWRKPTTKKKTMSLQYTLTYRDQWGKSAQQNVTSKNRTIHVNLRGLKPFTDYRIEVKCKPTEGGSFSNPSILQAIKTKEDVPAGLPRVAPGNFNVFGQGHLRIYWRKLEKHLWNGPTLHYILSYRKVGASYNWTFLKQLSHNVSHHEIRLDTQLAAYEFRVHAKSIGFNTSLEPKPIFIAQNPPSTSKPVAIANGTEVKVTWKAVEGAANYTVYWCQGNYEKCYNTSVLEWVDIDNTMSGHTVALKHKWPHSFKFALSVQKNEGGRVVSSGMEWAKCTYDSRAELQPPEELEFSKHQKVRSLTFRWASPNCKSAFPDSYTVAYKTEGQDVWGHKWIGDGRRTEYTLSNLYPYKTYILKMRSDFSKINLSSIWTKSISKETIHTVPNSTLLLWILIACGMSLVPCVIGTHKAIGWIKGCICPRLQTPYVTVPPRLENIKILTSGTSTADIPYAISIQGAINVKCVFPTTSDYIDETMACANTWKH